MERQAMIRKVIEIGQRTGFVTFDQVNGIFPATGDPEDIEALLTALSEAGIELTDQATSSPALDCSFCGKSQADVVMLVAGAPGQICNECVELCVGLIAHDHRDWLAAHIAFVNGLANEDGGQQS